MIKKMLPAIALLPALLWCQGCFDTNEAYILNPDGSGKVRLEAVIPMFSIMEPDPGPDENMRRTVREMLEKSEGIDAWSDVTWSNRPDGKIGFQGTAYFKDIEKVSFHNLGSQELSLRREDPHLVLAVKLMEKDDQDDADEAEDKTQTPEEARMEYQATRPMLAAILETMHSRIAVKLPGTVVRSSNLKANGDVAVVDFRGGDMLKALDQVMKDDQLLEETLKSGVDPVKEGLGDDFLFNQLIFGEKAAIEVVFEPGKVQFDYKASVSSVQPAYRTLLRDLRKTHSQPGEEAVDAAEGVPLQDVRLVGVSRIFADDLPKPFRPFNRDEGMEVLVAASLGGQVLEVDEVMVETAVDTMGNDLSYHSDWKRKDAFPTLSEDQSQVMFKAQLKSPGPGVEGLKELSGYASYTTASGTTNVDLEFSAVEEGVSGTKYGALIKEKGASSWGKKHALKVKLDLPRARVAGWTVLDADGMEIEMKPGGSSQMNQITEFDLTTDEPIPADGRILVELHDGVKSFTADYRLEDVRFDGREQGSEGP